MNNALVEEVAASLVREYLSRKGLKKTISIMDQELPRTNSSVNNRNDLRRVLKLESLYKMNKAQEIPLKAMLEIIVKHCMETQNMTNTRTEDCLFQKNTVPKSRSSVMSSVSVCDISDEEKGGSTAVSNQSKTDVYRSSDDIACTSYKFLSYTNSQSNSKISAKCVEKNTTSSEGERDSQQRSFSYAKDSDSLKVDVSSTEINNAFTELQKPRSGRIVRGMMAGPVASSQEESNKKRFLRRSSGSNVALPLKDEELKNNSTSNSVPSNLATIQRSQSKSISSVIEDPSTNELFERELNRMEKKDTHAVKSGQMMQKERGQSTTPNREISQAYKKKSTASPKADVLQMKLMKLDDINDEEEFCEPSRVPVFSSTSRLNVAAHPIDLNLAVDLKNILFGSSFACFNDEWKIQSFPFNDLPDLRYGIVQKKGGPCGVLASVQACVLQKLLFEETSISNKSQRLQPSDSQRSKKLALAIADILWRAGDRKKAVVALSSGEKQFIPAGRYKSDGILETIILHTVSSQEDLTLFLEQNIRQFEVGPYGCILLTVSAILSRSTDLVIRDFDVPTNSLIGAHGYCTQELVNLLLTGRAVSNVFNDVIELDSGNGNSTVLNGITGRSDIGLLSLFEHYNLCKVGSYLKTPKYPIWVICSESHFSVLFCVQKELMNDWRMERRFDLYYYDELANQQEEIRLTVDTSQNCVADAENDLIPPIEHCIRTKWKGAVVDWNGAEPLL
ncbi:putative ubiquitin carboxyl-terminal hydrolase MINDY-4 isoform X1 [Acipenser oxyrinchus oxyrinchus]|uniref:Ubiquitin carboxyl-terminal hydrolase MINDY n=1 Tax=Acipenser oxyrinchus oxyrinchus TaxID=40147 RepID=A0AAD8GEL4_ACIOX|nr:putative ubiquitin carboxyl-terminal hydrolase MINDY-4 isoform X1 [Acipenser oxyrinchus oxyrinchus]